MASLVTSKTDVAQFGDELKIVCFRMGVHRLSERNVYRFERASDPEFNQTRAEFFHDYWGNIDFLQFLVRFLAKKFRGDVVKEKYGYIKVGDVVIENLIPPALDGLPEFVVSRYITTDPTFLGAVTVGHSSYGESSFAMVLTTLTKEKYYLQDIMNTVEDLQKLVGLLSKVEPRYSDIMIDLFPADIGLTEQEKHAIADGDDIHLWFSEIYNKNFPSLEEQQQNVVDDDYKRVIWQEAERKRNEIEFERQRLQAVKRQKGGGKKKA
jgi:hypothetical protein